VLDPQGDTVRRALQDLGYDTVLKVRVGKNLEIHLEAPDREAAQGEVVQMCQRLLANPVIEEYSFTLSPLEGDVSP